MAFQCLASDLGHFKCLQLQPLLQASKLTHCEPKPSVCSHAIHEGCHEEGQCHGEAHEEAQCHGEAHEEAQRQGWWCPTTIGWATDGTPIVPTQAVQVGCGATGCTSWPAARCVDWPGFPATWPMVPP